jgi:signal peptidase I
MADTPAPRRRRAGRIVYWVLFALAVAAIVVSFAWIRLAGRGFTNSSTSMENTVRPGSTMLVEKGQGVRRGDVIALNRPGGPFIRRVIGLPGDRVACCPAGHVTVDGKPLDESYVYPGDQPSAATFSVTVGPGRLWVLGDHRSIAIDSRMWGPVPVSDVIGRVVAVLGGGAPQLLLRTPQAFVTASLAPADQRPPWVFVALSLGIVAAPILVILIVFGVIRTLIRRNRRRRPAGAFTTGPTS